MLRPRLKSCRLLAMTALFVLGCQESASTLTAPETPFNRLLVRVTLSRTEPPAGTKHAVVAHILAVARARAVMLLDVKAFNYRGTANVEVNGFVPVQLNPYKSTSFDVLLTSRYDIPCADELIIQVVFDDGARGEVGPFYNCEDQWFF